MGTSQHLRCTELVVSVCCPSSQEARARLPLVSAICHARRIFCRAVGRCRISSWVGRIDRSAYLLTFIRPLVPGQVPSAFGVVLLVAPDGALPVHAVVHTARVVDRDVRRWGSRKVGPCPAALLYLSIS